MSRLDPARSPRAPSCADPLVGDSAASEEVRATASLTDHFVWLRAALRRRFGTDLADDLAQETFLRVTRSDRGREVENPRGLLMTVARNLARDVFRRDHVRADHVVRSPNAPHWGGLHTAEDDLAVRETILSLPSDLREVLLLSKIGGLTNREIAQRYGL